jgi:hypothetical protein
MWHVGTACWQGSPEVNVILRDTIIATEDCEYGSVTCQPRSSSARQYQGLQGKFWRLPGELCWISPLVFRLCHNTNGHPAVVIESEHAEIWRAGQLCSTHHELDQNMQNAGQEHFITVNYMQYINWARMPLVCTSRR